MAKPCRARRRVTTTDQRTIERGQEPPHPLARHRRHSLGLIFGQHLVPETTATPRVGDG